VLLLVLHRSDSPVSDEVAGWKPSAKFQWFIFSMSKLETEGVQVGESADTLRERIANSSQIYSTRKDCQSLKQRILALVEDPGYWSTLACFLHGQCSKQTFDDAMHGFLKTPEVRILHNELIRSIIYNAHFAMSPPENTIVPRPEIPQHIKKAASSGSVSANASFATYTATDLRHLPSISQLSNRIEILLNSRKIRVDSKAAGLIFAQLKRFIVRLLENSTALLSIRSTGERNPVKITTTQIVHVICADADLVAVVSPAILTKYSHVSV
jgi:hypothetical protein